MGKVLETSDFFFLLSDSGQVRRGARESPAHSSADTPVSPPGWSWGACLCRGSCTQARPRQPVVRLRLMARTFRNVPFWPHKQGHTCPVVVNSELFKRVWTSHGALSKNPKSHSLPSLFRFSSSLHFFCTSFRLFVCFIFNWGMCPFRNLVCKGFIFNIEKIISPFPNHMCRDCYPFLLPFFLQPLNFLWGRYWYIEVSYFSVVRSECLN